MILPGLFLKVAHRQLSLPLVSASLSQACVCHSERVLPLRLSSCAFPRGGVLPSEYSYAASNTNPPLRIDGLPETARSLMILLEHRNAPIAPRTHWICWDIPPILEIQAGDQRGKPGRNDFLINGYTGPLGQPFSGSFCFFVFALRRPLHLPVGASCYQAMRLLTTELLSFGELPFYA
jgi:phosphatidylethanolamine-binding protein (PEBP) family uncharacterized protein